MSSDRATYYLHFLQRKLVRFDMTGGSDCLQRLSLEMLAISAECSFGALACSPGRLKRLDCSAESIRQKRSWDSFVRFMTYDEIYIYYLCQCVNLCTCISETLQQEALKSMHASGSLLFCSSRTEVV